MTTQTNFALRVYDGTEDPVTGRRMPDDLHPQMSLYEFWYMYVLPVVLDAGGAADLNICQYRESLRLWEEYTGGPALCDIDDYVCAEFVSAMKNREWRGKRVKSNTVRKHCIAVAKCLRLAGPRDYRTPAGQGLIRQVPYMPTPVDTADPPARDLSMEEIEAWLAACADARRPNLNGIDTAAWWTALILWSYNTGMRIGTTLTVTWSMFEDHWLVVPAAQMKGRRRGRKIWINQFARAAIETIRTDDDRLFSWSNLLASFHQVRRAAFEDLIAANPGRFAMHNLRRSLLTWLSMHNHFVARLQAGHSLAGDVLARFYVNPAIVRELMEKVPQPKLPQQEGEF